MGDASPSIMTAHRSATTRRAVITAHPMGFARFTLPPVSSTGCSGFSASMVMLVAPPFSLSGPFLFMATLYAHIRSLTVAGTVLVLPAREALQ